MTTVASTGTPAAASPKPATPAGEVATRKKRVRPARVVLYVFLTTIAFGWLAPILLLFYASLRPYQDTQLHGYFSLPSSLSFKYYSKAWNQGDMAHSFLNSTFVNIDALRKGGDLLNVFGDFPTLADPRHAHAYSPLWDAQLGLWTDKAVSEKRKKQSQRQRNYVNAIPMRAG